MIRIGNRENSVYLSAKVSHQVVNALSHLKLAQEAKENGNYELQKEYLEKAHVLEGIVTSGGLKKLIF